VLWSRYIRYVRDTAPSGSTQSSILIPLLERCTRTVWSQDIRYLRIWIQYSRLIEAKVDVFQFLLSSEVGTDWSALYEEYAVVLEGMGQSVQLTQSVGCSNVLTISRWSCRRSKADDTYKLGIARKAKPLERLKLRYNAFNIRMATPLPPNLFAPSVPDPDPSSRTRSTLGTLAGSSAPSLGSSSSSRPNGSSRKPGGMAIFVDGVEGGEAAEEDERRWHGQLGTRDEVRKENERESTVWKGETLPQGRGIAPRTPKLQIFKDDVSCFLSLDLCSTCTQLDSL
jgi:checkpoint serine/threonine-protein kinase